MRRTLLLLLLASTFSAPAYTQKIDNSNYYTYFAKSGNLNWLRSSDAIPIIIDELLKNDIPYHTINVGNLHKLNDSTRFVVTVAFKKDQKQYGIVYEPNHGLPINVRDREFLTDKTKAAFVEVELDNNGQAEFMKIFPLPGNIFLLKQRCYWYNEDELATPYKVDKAVAEDILRQDIRQYIASPTN